MVKEIKENVSKDKDKDGTAFVFIEGVISCGLVGAVLGRVERIGKKEEIGDRDGEVLELNMAFLGHIVHLYYLLL